MSKLEHIKKHLKKMKTDRNSILIGIAVLAVIVTAVLIFVNSNTGFSLPTIFGLSDSQIAKNTVNYINDNQLSTTPATLVKFSEASGLVKVTIKIGTSQFDSYVTKDGKFLFPQAFDMTPKKGAAPANQKANSNQNASTTPTAVQKTDKPLLEAFVVSSCPYGLQMQRAVADAVKNISSLAADIKIRYIGSISGGVISSMHGQEEAQENLRQICIREEQQSKYYNYISCYMKKTAGTMANGMPLGDTKGCLASTGIDTAKLNSCVSDSKRGLAYAQADFDLANKYNVSGSPTLILNGAQISESNYGGRSSDAVKAMVCAGSSTQESFCSTKLNTAAAAASFNATYASGSGSGSANTNCAPAAQ
jgi:hypothetical protein